MEQQIKMAAKLYKCRDTAKKFYGIDYPKIMETYIQIIKKVMTEQSLEEIPALLFISKTEVYNEGFNSMLFMAAIVEMIEPSS